MRNTPLLIAVVDDDHRLLVALRRLLRTSGFDVETFPSGTQFLESLKVRQPDCVLLDLDMPQPDGFAVLAQVANAHIRLPVVIVTAADPGANRDRALTGGASAYLNKPVRAEQLLDAIAAAMAAPSS